MEYVGAFLRDIDVCMHVCMYLVCVVCMFVCMYEYNVLYECTNMWYMYVCMYVCDVCMYGTCSSSSRSSFPADEMKAFTLLALLTSFLRSAASREKKFTWHVCMYAHVYMHMYVCMYVLWLQITWIILHIHTVHKYIHTYIHTYTFLPATVYIHTYIHTYIHAWPTSLSSALLPEMLKSSS